MAKKASSGIKGYFVNNLGGIITFLFLIGLPFTGIVSSTVNIFGDEPIIVSLSSLGDYVFGLNGNDILVMSLLGFILSLIGALLLFSNNKILKFIGGVLAIAGGVMFFIAPSTYSSIPTTDDKSYLSIGSNIENDLITYLMGTGTIIAGVFPIVGGLIGVGSIFVK